MTKKRKYSPTIDFEPEEDEKKIIDLSLDKWLSEALETKEKQYDGAIVVDEITDLERLLSYYGLNDYKYVVYYSPSIKLMELLKWLVW